LKIENWIFFDDGFGSAVWQTQTFFQKFFWFSPRLFFDLKVQSVALQSYLCPLDKIGCISEIKTKKGVFCFVFRSICTIFATSKENLNGYEKDIDFGCLDAGGIGSCFRTVEGVSDKGHQS